MSFWEDTINVTWKGAGDFAEYLYQYVDIYYLSYLLWLLYPLVVTFVLPVLIMLFVYASALFLHVYRLRHFVVPHAYNQDFWKAGRNFLAALWDAQGKIWHGKQ